MSNEDPRGSVQRRKLHIVLMADCSGSMDGDKIQTLNQAVRECVPELVDLQTKNPFADMVLRAISFSDGARWHVGSETSVESFAWSDLEASGLTALGAAIRLLGEALEPSRMGKRNLPPVVVLLSDGAPTDDWEAALADFNASDWGGKGRTVRVAIAIGRAASIDVLESFTGNPETVLGAANATQLGALIRWATVSVSKSVSSGASVVGSNEQPLPPLPPEVLGVDDDDEAW